MGMWASGLLGNDGALDYISSEADRLKKDIDILSREKSSLLAATRLGAATGLLLQFSPWDLYPNSRFIPRFRAALDQHRACLQGLPPRAQKVLKQIAEDGRKLADRRARGVDRRVLKALNRGPMGYREASLFEGPHAISYVHQFANSCVQFLEQEFSSPGTTIFDVQSFLGLFALLLQVEPCKVGIGKIRSWRKLIQAMNEKDSISPDESVFGGWMQNVELAFEVALEKFSSVRSK